MGEEEVEEEQRMMLDNSVNSLRVGLPTRDDLTLVSGQRVIQ